MRIRDWLIGTSPISTAAARRLLLQGGTLLHVAAEYGSTEAAQLLMDHGADPNARAMADATNLGHTPIFHSVTQFGDRGLVITRLLLERGADLSIRASLPGHYERPEEIVEGTPLDYALRFPGAGFPGSNEKTVQLLQLAKAARGR